MSPPLGFRRRPHREFLAAAAGGKQTDADFHQANVTFQRSHSAVRVHDEFAAAAQRHAVHRRDRRDHRVTQCLRGSLELLHHLLDFLQAPRHQRVGHVERARRLENRRLRPRA